MSINKDMYDGIQDECLKEEEIVQEKIYNEYRKEDKINDNDMYDEFHGKCSDEDKYFNKFSNHKDSENYPHQEESKISVNCKLEVCFDTKNKMIYLSPGKFQYFTVDVSKCCGDVNIKYKGYYPSKGICGNLGIYRIVQSGILVETYHKLNPRKNDYLYFTAFDKCTKDCYDFVVIFSSKSYRCCY